MVMFLRTPLTKRTQEAFAIMIVTSCEMTVFVLPPSFLWMAHMPLASRWEFQGPPFVKGLAAHIEMQKAPSHPFEME